MKLYFFQFDPAKMDRVELAFRKFDLNQDGYLSREEFDQVFFFKRYWISSQYVWNALSSQILEFLLFLSADSFSFALLVGLKEMEA